MCALSLFLVNCGSSSSRPSGLLYVLTQGSNGTGNNVSSFAIDLNSGNLSLINSNASTCATAASIVRASAGHCARPDGRGGVCSESGCACMCLRRRTIYAYTVNSDGSLSELAHSLLGPDARRYGRGHGARRGREFPVRHHGGTIRRLEPALGRPQLLCVQHETRIDES